MAEVRATAIGDLMALQELVVSEARAARMRRSTQEALGRPRRAR